MHTSACFKIVNKCKISKFARFKFKDFSRIFKYFQASYLFSSTFKGLEVFIPNSSIFKDFSSTLWTLWGHTTIWGTDHNIADESVHVTGITSRQCATCRKRARWVNDVLQPPNFYGGQPNQMLVMTQTQAQCPKCGGQWHESFNSCPAVNKNCRLCSKKGHFLRVCRAAARAAMQGQWRSIRLGSAARIKYQKYIQMMEIISL